MAPQAFQNPNPFAFQPPHLQHAQTFPPHQFSHHASSYENFGGSSSEPSKIDDSMRVDVEMQEHSPTAGFIPQSFEATMRQVPAPQPVEK
jgi:hypothetical protein